MDGHYLIWFIVAILFANLSLESDIYSWIECHIVLSIVELVFEEQNQ